MKHFRSLWIGVVYAVFTNGRRSHVITSFNRRWCVWIGCGIADAAGSGCHGDSYSECLERDIAVTVDFVW